MCLVIDGLIFRMFSGRSGDGCEADKGGGRVESKSEDEKEERYAPISG